MEDLPQDVYGRWTHSFEEDSGGTKVYRPADYDFPPARGRGGIELREDGTFIEWGIGRADAPQGTEGRWRQEEAGVVRVDFEGPGRSPRTFEIVEHGPGMLKLRD